MRFRLSASAALLAIAVAQSQTLPAPTVDRVGFPTGYEKWPLLYVFDRPDNKQIRAVYSNEVASSVRFGNQGAYPYGSVVVMETWPTLQDAQGNPILDANGRFQKQPGAVPTLNVMRKEKGFGEAYKENRNGEWEYVGYRMDGSFNTTPANSGACAACHLQGGQGKDFVMRGSLGFNAGSGAVPFGIIKAYSFVPGVIRAKAGSTITIYNDDVVEHTIADDDAKGWTSQRMKGGSSIAIKLGDKPGEFNFHCSLHPAMKGKVIVE
ncbi:MAG: cytochrome P460 family protein [Bryobacteraceae bacterium]